MARVIVAGAGISGLTAAYALRRAGHEVVVLDEGGRTGGRMHSERVAGFLMEHGPSGMALPAPRAESLVTDLGLAPERIARAPAARSRYLVRDGRVHEVPLQPHRFFRSGILSPAGRLRVLLEPFVAAKWSDETIADFTRRRFGRELLDYVVDPLVAGIYAGDPHQLSVSAVFPHLKRLERLCGSVILAAARSRLRPGVKPAACDFAKRASFSFREGMGMLPQAIARHLACDLYLNQRVEAVERAAGGEFVVTVRERGVTRSLKADGVVIALPAYAAARTLDRLDARVAGALAEIGHPPLAVVFLGYRARGVAHPLDGAGALTPAVEGRDVLGMLFSSTLFAGRAPPGHVALTVFVGGARQPQLALLQPRELQDLAHDEVRRLLGARAGPVLARTRCWRHGLPQPGLDHARRIAAITALESEHAGLFFTGNYFSGVSTVACIEQATDTAQRVQQYLASSRGRSRQAAAPFRSCEAPEKGGRSAIALRVTPAGQLPA